MTDVLTAKPKSRTWKAWKVTKNNKDFPTQYFTHRLSQRDGGDKVVFCYRGEQREWTPAYAVGSWMLFDGDRCTLNLTDKEFEYLYEVI